MLRTRSPLDLPECCHALDLVRLACVKHAASVRPEPGSNSPLNAYRHGPRKAIVNKNRENAPLRPEGRTNTRSQSQTRANARKFETTIFTTMLWTPEADSPPHRQQATPAPEQNGTDFRYAVEFSKYGRTPATTARPSWGQPWKHYPARFAVSNCPTRSARLAVIGMP